MGAGEGEAQSPRLGWHPTLGHTTSAPVTAGFTGSKVTPQCSGPEPHEPALWYPATSWTVAKTGCALPR